MIEFQHALVLLLLVASLGVVGRWLPWPQLITYLIGGVGAALVPAFPQVKLEPGFFFLCFLPPLLFSDGWLMPLREFVRAKRPILTLAIGLVIFTTLAVGFVAHALVPGLPLAMALALGAIVSPTDAVAVSAITERLRVPARLSTILSGESLMNDATGLVGFKFALAAVVVGGFSLRRMTLEFSFLAIGGFALGLAIGYGIGKLRDLLRRVHASDAYIETTLSLLTPYAAYLAAERLEASGVLAVVAAGLYSGWRDPVRMDAEARQTAYEGLVGGPVLAQRPGLRPARACNSPGSSRRCGINISILRLLGFTAVVAGTAMAAAPALGLSRRLPAVPDPRGAGE